MVGVASDRVRAGSGPTRSGLGRRLLRVFAAQGIFWSVLVAATAGPARPAAAAPPVVTATLVQTIQTWQFKPASPDPSGIVYLPGPDRLEIVDSEVDETTGAGWHGVNLWQITHSGAVTDTGTTHPAFSREPTGLGFDPATDTLFISDDSKRKVFLDEPGSDGRFGTSDDIVTSVDAGTYGSTDTEDPEFDTTSGNPTSGHLFFLDGIGTEVYDVDPVNGIFGDGNDAMTHFDVGYLGPSDFEGLASDGVRNTLLVGARSAKKIFEVTKSGALVRTIDASGIAGLKHISGLAMAPASDDFGRMNYWIVDRQVDNGSNSSENDGKLFEITVPSSDAPPSVSITSPADGSVVSGTVTITADASDDKGLSQVEFFVDGNSLGLDGNGADGWSAPVPWDTTGGPDGAHTVTATATDTIGQTGTDSNDVTVDNVDSPPTVSITSPADGSVVSGTVTITADASDDKGLSQVEFLVDGNSLGVDGNGADGWSAPVPWDTTTVPDGSDAAVTATATDDHLPAQTASDTNNVTVDQTPTMMIDLPVTVGADDAEEKSTGRIALGNGDLDMMTDGTSAQRAVGLRFTGVDVPPGALVTSAYIQFQANETSSSPTSLTIKGDASANAAPFTNAKFNITNRPTTTSSAETWTPASWIRGERGTAQRTTDLSSVLTEIFRSANGWSPGNALVLVITGSGKRVAEPFEGGAPPVLHIEYTA